MGSRLLRLDVPIRPLWCHRLSVHIQRCGHGRAREKVTRMGTTRPLHHHPFLSSGNEVLRGMEAPDDPRQGWCQGLPALAGWSSMAGP